MDIHEKGEAFVEKDGDLVFSHTKLILKDGQQYFYAVTPRRCRSISRLDLAALELHSIPVSNIWPEFTEKLTQVLEPLPSHSFVKQNSLLDYGDTPASKNLGSLLLKEARICEILRKHPHPNIVEYRGCLVEDEKLTGLCFVRYGCTLTEIVRNGHPFDKELCLQGIENGIQHIHSLGFIHCDIKPDNILIDGANPRVGDFDSCYEEGSELGAKVGTMGWSNDNFKIATRDIDWYGLSKIKKFLLDRTVH